MKKPTGYIAFNTILILRLIAQALLIGLVIFFASTTPAPGTGMAGFRQGLLEALTGVTIDAVTRSMVMESAGRLCFPALLLGLTMLFLHKRSYKAVMIMTVLVLFADLGQLGLGLLLSVVQLVILLVSKPTKEYLKQPSPVMEGEQV